MTQELQPYAGGNMLAMTFQETLTLAQAFSDSGYFADARQAQQALVKIMAGRELGIPPFAAMNAYHIIQNKPCLAASAMAGLVRRSKRYNYQIVEHTDDVCEIMFYELRGNSWVECGPSSRFTKQDATRAGTQNMGKFPRNMLFARAMSNGFRWYCNDLSSGPIYVPEDLGSVVNMETGEIIDLTPPEPQLPALPKPVTGNGNGSDDHEKSAQAAAVKSFKARAEKLGYPDLSAPAIGALIKETLNITGRPTVAQIGEAEGKLLPFDTNEHGRPEDATEDMESALSVPASQPNAVAAGR